MPRLRSGRDFVVGDLHGHREAFERELTRLAFDPTRDRVFSVGDLVDRGPDSLATLALVDEPWFHPVLGNHELTLLQALGCCSSRAPGRKDARPGPGSAWIADAVDRHRRQLMRLADRLRVLPLMMEVEADVPFRVVHSEWDRSAAGPPDDRAGEGEPAQVPIALAERLTSSREHHLRRARAGGTVLRYLDRPVEVGPEPLAGRCLTYLGHTPTRHLTVQDAHVYLEQGIGAVGRFATRVPTVLDARHFGLWLHGVSSAMTDGRHGSMTPRSTPSAAPARPAGASPSPTLRP